MMKSSQELSAGFDCKPQSFSMLMKSFGDHTNNNNEQTQKLEEFLALLEEERIKIDAFKRELPLCMQLLTNAMDASRQQLQSQRTNQESSRPVLEQFIPLKNTSSTELVLSENVSVDKANWMTSAQLWNVQDNNEGAKSPLVTSSQENDIKLALNGKQRSINSGGAFLPFSSKDRNSSSSEFPELALASSHKEESDDHKKKSPETNSEKDQIGGSTNTNQTHRKARRCWSPDLHRRFVNALHMLGGSQVATPKQIRELMKVDGLTNDEVKSHLQKYRLHTRRPSPSPGPQNTVPGAPQLVVLGGIWVPSEYAAAAAAHGGAQAAAMYGAHASQHMSQDMYPTLAPPPTNHHQMHHHNHPIRHHQFHMYNKPPPMNSSLESEVQGGAGDQSESIEDEKSESGSWKADSCGEHGGERKGVLVEVDEKSNGSVGGLKF